jgi:hypothetical protein
MTAAKSGISVSAGDLPIIFGMINRGDRRHDIAAWFGLNQGRIKEAEDGKYGTAEPAPVSQLPPSGSPGPRAVEIRAAVEKARQLLKAGNAVEAAKCLDNAIRNFDRDE